jgi:hypothetical protein
MNLKQIANGIWAIACLIGAIMLLLGLGQAQDAGQGRDGAPGVGGE